MGESFWQKDSLITHTPFELWLIMIFSPVANFAQQSLGLLISKIFLTLLVLQIVNFLNFPFSLDSSQKASKFIGILIVI